MVLPWSPRPICPSAKRTEFHRGKLVEQLEVQGKDSVWVDNVRIFGKTFDEVVEMIKKGE